MMTRQQNTISSKLLMLTATARLTTVLLTLLTVGAGTGVLGEVLNGGGCESHRTRLVVVCEGLNASSLQQHLAQDLQYLGTSGLRSSAWVRDLVIVSSHLPVVDTVVPTGVDALRKLHLLQVVGSQVKQVSVEAMVQVAESLHHLSLSHNKLVAVPAAVSLLSRLETLDLRYNAITRLSPLLARLPRLRTLRLDHNRIRQLSGWSTASPHRHLAHLGLADNILHEVWRRALNSLPALQRLDLSRNYLQRLPRDIALPHKLIELDLRDNPWHCDCSTAWLRLMQQRPLVTHLPHCRSPLPLRDQSLDTLTTDDLCNGSDLVNDTRKISADLTNEHMKLSMIEPRNFKLSWNVSDISHRGKRVQEYLGWRVTFRKFGDRKESEVLLITLAGEDVSRKTGTSSGQYTVKNLTPDTAYLVCFNTLSDGEVNNIIETEKSWSHDDDITSTTTMKSILPELARSRSLYSESSEDHPLNAVFNEEWDKFWSNRLNLTTTEEAFTEQLTTTPQTVIKSTTVSAILPPTSNQNFVYTNTGQRIPTNFGPPGVPFAQPNLPTGDGSSFNLNIFNDPNFIRNVPPPPPPTNFGESGARFPFPLVKRKRRSLIHEHNKNEEKGRCVEVNTPAEDELVMPVTVAATASSSTTMVLLMICCCCFPKRCNKMRDCCTSKCKSLTKKTIIKTNSKTKTFVRVPATQIKAMLTSDKSASTPDLRFLETYSTMKNDYNYPKFNKYYTMRPKDIDNYPIELFPGYDLPKSATAKLYGYDFPRNSSPTTHLSGRRLSTDDNVSPIESDRFQYYNLNKFKANLNIPIEQCKYSEKMKGLSYYGSNITKFQFPDYQIPALGTPRKVSNREQYNIKPNLLKTNTLCLSRSSPELRSTQPIGTQMKKSNKIESSRPGGTVTGRYYRNNPGYESSPGKTSLQLLRERNNMAKSTDAKLEIVRQIEPVMLKRPTILNISHHSLYDHPKQQPQNQIHNFSSSVNITPSPSTVPNTPSQSYVSNSFVQPNRIAGTRVLEHSGRRDIFQSSSREPEVPPSPIGEVAVTGGTLVEVPEGYVLPGKPRPINILRLKVPADFPETSAA